MFNKVATFKMLPPGRSTRSTTAPANDNRRNTAPCALQRNRAPRLVCRWSLSESTGRPVCRWELDEADEPSPRSVARNRAPRVRGGLHHVLAADSEADAGQQVV
jgi:hypothetical protein